MRNIAVILVLFLSLGAYGADMLDVDYNFIDTAFDGIKPITNKQFNDTINRLTPQPVPDTFGGKLKAFLFGRKYGVENPPPTANQEKKIDIGGEKQAIQDLKNGIYYIRLVASIVGADGKIIPLGNYKIQHKMIGGADMLVFYQGHEEYGMLPLRRFEDTQKGKHDLAYSRVDIISPSAIRIVYATIEDTKCAVARVYQ